jgi:hypothetical protein
MQSWSRNWRLTTHFERYDTEENASASLSWPNTLLRFLSGPSPKGLIDSERPILEQMHRFGQDHYRRTLAGQGACREVPQSLLM